MYALGFDFNVAHPYEPLFMILGTDPVRQLRYAWQGAVGGWVGEGWRQGGDVVGLGPAIVGLGLAVAAAPVQRGATGGHAEAQHFRQSAAVPCSSCTGLPEHWGAAAVRPGHASGGSPTSRAASTGQGGAAATTTHTVPAALGPPDLLPSVCPRACSPRDELGRSDSRKAQGIGQNALIFINDTCAGGRAAGAVAAGREAAKGAHKGGDSCGCQRALAACCVPPAAYNGPALGPHLVQSSAPSL